MKLPLPRSLAAQAALLIAGSVLVSLLLASAGFYWLVQVPRIQALSTLAAQQVHNVRAMLDAMDSLARRRFVVRLMLERAASVNTGSRMRLEAGPPPEASTAPLPFAARKFMRLLEPQLPAGSQVVIQGPPFRQLWISLPILRGSDESRFWLVTPVERVELDTLAGLGFVALATLLPALFAGAVVYARVRRPTRQLTEAIGRIGAGQTLTEPPVTSPAEFARIGIALTDMQERQLRMEADRRLMLAGVSHDLRTPLTRIGLALEMLRDAARDPDDPLWQGIAANLRHLDANLTQFLDFARDERDETEVRVDLNDILREVAAACDADGQPVELQLLPVPPMPCRPQALMRALRNLIDNAWKYGAAPVQLSSCVDQGRVQVSVQDHGLALDASTFERLRQPFARSNAARDNQGVSGSGLGLAIVDRIMALHGASVQFQAQQGGGLKVCLSFPEQI